MVLPGQATHEIEPLVRLSERWAHHLSLARSTLLPMTYGHLPLWDLPERPCRYCQHYGRETGGGVWCARQKYVNATGRGCASWEREPGSDDDAEPVLRASRREVRNDGPPFGSG